MVFHRIENLTVSLGGPNYKSLGAGGDRGAGGGKDSIQQKDFQQKVTKETKGLREGCTKSMAAREFIRFNLRDR